MDGLEQAFSGLMESFRGPVVCPGFCYFLQVVQCEPGFRKKAISGTDFSFSNGVMTKRSG